MPQVPMRVFRYNRNGFLFDGTAVSFILLLIGAGIYSKLRPPGPHILASQSAPRRNPIVWQKIPALARNEPHEPNRFHSISGVRRGHSAGATPVSHDTLGYAVPQRNYVVNTKSAPPVQVVRSEPGKSNPPHTFSTSTSILEPLRRSGGDGREDSISAKTYFQTGLRLYNTAFTKVGKNPGILQSAVVFLSDLESNFQEQSSGWHSL